MCCVQRRWLFRMFWIIAEVIKVKIKCTDVRSLGVPHWIEIILGTYLFIIRKEISLKEMLFEMP